MIKFCHCHFFHVSPERCVRPLYFRTHREFWFWNSENVKKHMWSAQGDFDSAFQASVPRKVSLPSRLGGALGGQSLWACSQGSPGPQNSTDSTHFPQWLLMRVRKAVECFARLLCIIWKWCDTKPSCPCLLWSHQNPSYLSPLPA